MEKENLKNVNLQNVCLFDRGQSIEKAEADKIVVSVEPPSDDGLSGGRGRGIYPNRS